MRLPTRIPAPTLLSLDSFCTFTMLPATFTIVNWGERPACAHLLLRGEVGVYAEPEPGELDAAGEEQLKPRLVRRVHDRSDLAFIGVEAITNTWSTHAMTPPSQYVELAVDL
jgi:hypothetical protein